MNQVDFIGNVLSLSCGEALGTFQGEVSAVSKDAQTISLKNAYRNGVKYEVPEVTIRAIDIKDLRILKTFEQVLQEKVQNIAARKPPKVTIGANGKIANKDGISKKLAAEKIQQKIKNTPQKCGEKTRGNTPKKNAEQNGGRTPKGKLMPDDVSDAVKMSPLFTSDAGKTSPRMGKKNGSCKKALYQNGDIQNGHGMNNKEQHIKDDYDGGRRRHPSTGAPQFNEHSKTKSQPIKIEAGKGRGRGVNSKNRECFSAPTDGYLDDFDFDTNLKLFNKAAVFEEIDALSGGENEVPVKKFYGHDENVLTEAENCALLEGNKVVYKTVSGKAVPSISTMQQQKLFLAAEKVGFSAERRVESVGINAAHMALQLLGGAKRFQGEAQQESPSVVVLAGPHIQGAQGVCCARHLANHNVDVTVFSTSYVKMADSITSELTLFKETGGKHITNVKELPSRPVDLIILALDCPNDVIIRDQPWYKDAIEWTKTKHAIMYAVDPPANSTQKVQFTLAIGLPLSYLNDIGAVYLCDVGIPKKVFLTLDIGYKSPFGHRHVIPLRSS